MNSTDKSIVVKIDFLTENECLELVTEIHDALKDHPGCSYIIKFGNNASVTSEFD